jgi:Zn-dependent metalloprotease
MGGPGRLGRSLVPEYATECGQIGVDGENVASDESYMRRDVDPPGMHAAWRALAAEPGVHAQVRWSGVTGMPHRAWATGVRLAGGPFVTQDAVASASRAFLRERASLLLAGEAPGDNDIPLIKAHRVGDVWFLVFGQRYHGLEVVDGRVDLRVRTDGSIPVFGSDWFPGVDVRTSPLVLAGVAEAVARAGIGFRDGVDTDGGSDLAILPVPDGKRVGYRLVHRVRLSIDHPPGEWTTFVDAQDGRVWARENAVRWVASTAGGVDGAILPRTWTNAFETRPFRQEEVWRGTDTTITTTAGDWALAGRQPQDTVFTQFRSPFLRIRNQARRDVILGGRGHPPSRPLDFEWTDANSDTAERNAYYHALAAHARLKVLDPSLTGMDYRVTCRVNLSYAACNAFWDGKALNFFATGMGCANMASVADVIYHEYGHGITQHTYDPLLPNPGLNEGFSDYFACSTLNDPVVGRDLEGPGTYVRLLENDAQILDPDCDGDPHCLSLGNSGALWDMRKGFIAALGPVAGVAHSDSLWHFAGYGGAYWSDDYLLDVLVVDDNDGTLLDGTPHYGIIKQAFTRHGFLCPDTVSGAWIDHQPIADADLSPNAFPVSAEMGSSAGALVAARVHYSVNHGAWQDAALAGNGVHYTGALPALPQGGQMDYWLEARDGVGNGATSPEGAPARVHTFHVGKLRTIFSDDFSHDYGWYAGDDRPNSLGGWRRVDPIGTEIGSFRLQPEQDVGNLDHVCWVTGDTTNVGVEPTYATVKDGCTSLWSPPFDLSGLTNARITYWRWFTDEFAYDDTLWIEASGDSGVTWAVIEGQPFTQNFWRQRSFDLGSLIPLTDKVLIRVTACDICLPSLVEAAFDDYSFTTRDTVAAGYVAGLQPETQVARTRYDLALALGSASPARGPSEIRYTVPGMSGGSAVPVRLYVVDVRGRLVATLVHEALRPGESRVTWSGADAGGRIVAPGIYAARLEAGDRATTLKIVRMP